MIVHATAIGHKDNEKDRVTASLPAIDDVTSSGQKTATGHSESGIDPRIETVLPESESARAKSRSDPKIATARGRTATERMTTSNALDRER